MAATVRMDKIDTTSLEEVNGVIVKLERRAVITGANTASMDYRALNEALAIAGVPVAGSRLTGTGYDHLVLVRRRPKVISSRKDFFVDLDYEPVLAGPNQDFTNLGFPGIVYGRTRCSVVQKNTNFRLELDPGGTGQYFKKQITVQHTYPPDDPDFAGETQTQGGEVSFYDPQRTLSFEGYRDTLLPWVMANFLIASINTNSWASQGPKEWMCTEVSWNMMKKGRYHFGFEFQHNSDTWDPMAVFIDSRTGRPPVGLVEDVGYKRVSRHREVNFNAAFNAFFEGWQMAFAPILA